MNSTRVGHNQREPDDEMLCTVYGSFAEKLRKSKFASFAATVGAHFLQNK